LISPTKKKKKKKRKQPSTVSFAAPRKGENFFKGGESDARCRGKGKGESFDDLLRSWEEGRSPLSKERRKKKGRTTTVFIVGQAGAKGGGGGKGEI